MNPGSLISRSTRTCLRNLLILSGILGYLSASSAAIIPYPMDVDTLQLWHFDESPSASVCSNAVPGGIPLTAIRDGATLGNAALPGFGASASTYDAGPSATLAAHPNGIPGRDAYLAPLPIVNGTEDNTSLSFVGTNGAFTLEALIRADFSPTNQAVAPDSGRLMQIISADAEETVRLFQFRISWNSVNDTTPEIQFINIGTPIQTLSAGLPTTGPNAIVSSNWYHVAVTYNGLENTPGNFSLFWTRADASRTQADLLASLRMTNDLPVGSADWAIGNDGRATGGSDQNWVGLIDEVRLSGVARPATEFLFHADSDGDGLPDWWESRHFNSLSQTGADDPDGDTFTNILEYQGGSNPTIAASIPTDKDGDTLPDAWEIQFFGSLLPQVDDDPDSDGFSNAAELAAGTNPNNPLSQPGDSDQDGLPDAWELASFGSLTHDAAEDTDGDWFTNLREYQSGTDPNNADSYPPGPRVRIIPVEDGDPNTSEYAYSGGINTAAFIRSAIMTVGNQQFLTYYGRHQTDANHLFNNKLWVARRTLGSSRWEVFHTNFQANNITDGHDCISFGIDGLGHMHISWGMHGDAYHYAKSVVPVTGTNAIVFGPDGTMTGKENSVTYPQFLTLHNGDLLYFFREGGSGNGDLFLNRYSIAAQQWTNVHLTGTSQMSFIKGTGWSPNYNAYWQTPCIDASGNIFLIWTWRYNSDSPAGEVGYQTNHDYDYAWSPDGGLTWKRSNGMNYVLPINERGENGNTNSIAEKILSIPEGSSLMNQSGMCLDRSGEPVLANWWAHGAVTNNHRRQYMVAFPGTNGWQVRQLSSRTIDPPTYKVPETALGDMGRPTIVCDKDDRLIVIYRDNEGANGLTIVHSLPKARDPERRIWTQFDLTTDNLGRFDAPNLDLNRWEKDNVLHIFYLPVNGQGYTAPNTAAPIGVLEWDAASYFNHVPTLRLAITDDATSITWSAQAGWGYRLQTSSDLLAWDTVDTLAGTNGVLGVTITDLPLTKTFWRLEVQEGGF